MKSKIVLKHSRIEINDYEPGDSRKLEYMFSIWDPVRFTTYFKGIEYIEEKKQLRLPRGMSINLVKDIFFAEPEVDRQCDPYVSTDPIPIKYLTKDERQYDILKFILGVDKYKYTLSKSQIAINSTTGSGKTFITIAAICYSGSRAIIITNSLDWLKQWESRIYEYTPLSNKQVYMISGSASITKLYNRDPLQYQIFLCSHSTLKSYGDKNGWGKVDDLFKYLRCAMKIFDEAHLFFDNMCKIDFHSNTKKTLYLTATPGRSAQSENEIYQIYFRNIPSISLFNEDTDPHVNYVAMHFNSHPRPIDISRCKNNYGFDRNKYVSYIVEKEQFHMLTAILIDLVFNINGKCLIFIGTNDGIKKTIDRVLYYFPFLAPCIGMYTSIIDPAEKEANMYKKIIFSTTKSAGTASDIRDLRVVINLAEPFKSEILSRQTLGRCRADNTLYIDVVDEGFYFTKKYYQAKKPIFSKYSKSCKDVMLNDAEIQSRFQNILEKYSSNKVMCVPVFKS